MTYLQLLIKRNSTTDIDNNYTVGHLSPSEVFNHAPDGSRWFDQADSKSVCQMFDELNCEIQVLMENQIPTEAEEVSTFKAIIEYQVREKFYSHLTAIVWAVVNEYNLSDEHYQTTEAVEKAITVIIEDLLKFIEASK